ncbi:NAD(P)/FAD-dependent oxidoreductase [Niallia sp. Man26]|uniref:NAD(P)/FAD-dependent oxidoreductase n=1 Tax=Niallia sp. Man26 TaxID=2912824 RepID=UPI001EDBCB28|nr:NAD(P)/FAD-dependent oxidoreductase [Niallia sp. Man26]UPO90087.1 NAD(P)-binding domain-containing protein [Niallia sp. Man26]
MKLVIVGAGPSGIGLGILLKKMNFEDFVILEKEEIGASFRKWPKEMKLITPSFTGHGFGMLDLNALTPETSPAFTFGKEHLTGNEYADYLQLLAHHYKLPIKKAYVDKVVKDNNKFLLYTDKQMIEAPFLVWATGEYQTPNLKPFEGAELALHNSLVKSWDNLQGDEFTVIGGYESGIDAAYHLTANEKNVTVISRSAPWDNVEADPSKSLSPFTKERLEIADETGRLELLDVEVLKISKRDDDYVLYLSDGTTHVSKTRPILAAGFIPGVKQIYSLFEWENEQSPKLTDKDESTITAGVFLAGPNVRHQQVIFCYIYKFRQRFAVIVKEILDRTNFQYPTEIFDLYRKNNLFLDDLSCCEVNCEC